MHELLYNEDNIDKILNGIQPALARINAFAGFRDIPEDRIPELLESKLIKKVRSRDGSNVLMTLQYRNVEYTIYRNGIHGMYHFSSVIEAHFINDASDSTAA